MRLGGCWGQRTGKKHEGQGVNWACQVPSSLPVAAQSHSQPLTTIVISGILRSGISIPIVKALGFEEASSFLTKVSGVKHPALGRARLLGEPGAGG